MLNAPSADRRRLPPDRRRERDLSRAPPRRPTRAGRLAHAANCVRACVARRRAAGSAAAPARRCSRPADAVGPHRSAGLRAAPRTPAPQPGVLRPERRRLQPLVAANAGPARSGSDAAGAHRGAARAAAGPAACRPPRRSTVRARGAATAAALLRRPLRPVAAAWAAPADGAPPGLPRRLRRGAARRRRPEAQQPLVRVDGDLLLRGPLTLGTPQRPVLIVVDGAAPAAGRGDPARRCSTPAASPGPRPAGARCAAR